MRFLLHVGQRLDREWVAHLFFIAVDYEQPRLFPEHVSNVVKYLFHEFAVANH